MKRLLSTFALALALVLTFAATAPAQTISFCVSLDGAQETPPVVTPGTGSGTATFDTVTKMLSLNVSYSGLVGTVTAAHIHGPAAVGVPAGIVFPLTATNPITDTVGPLSAAQELDLLGGLYYVNIHSTFKTGGEIRGQILGCPVPTEKSTWGQVKSRYR
jgi:hypothetical protein